MIETIYTELIARLTSAEAVAYYTAKSIAQPNTFAWWANQVEQALNDDAGENKTEAFARDAIFFEFDEPEIKPAHRRQKVKGNFTLHVVSDNNVDGTEGSGTHGDFKDQLNYPLLIKNIVHGFRLPCSVVPVFVSLTPDHTNRALKDTRLKFKYTGVVIRERV